MRKTLALFSMLIIGSGAALAQSTASDSECAGLAVRVADRSAAEPYRLGYSFERLRDLEQVLSLQVAVRHRKIERHAILGIPG